MLEADEGISESDFYGVRSSTLAFHLLARRSCTLSRHGKRHEAYKSTTLESRVQPTDEVQQGNQRRLPTVVAYVVYLHGGSCNNRDLDKNAGLSVGGQMKTPTLLFFS